MGGITCTCKLSLDNRIISDLSRPISINQLGTAGVCHKLVINSTISNGST